MGEKPAQMTEETPDYAKGDRQRELEDRQEDEVDHGRPEDEPAGDPSVPASAEGTLPPL